MDLLYAPRESSLHSIALTLARIENLSHIVAWASGTALTKCVDGGSGGGGGGGESNTFGTPLADVVAMGVPDVSIVELPRLKLRFRPRGGRLYSVDHTDLFISNDRHALVQKLVAGVPNALIMSNEQDEKQLLVPVLCPMRPTVTSQPLSTTLVMDRSDNAKKWYSALTQRFFLYPVHLSLSFLMTKGVSSALYLLLLRFLNRNYAEVSALVDSIATDTQYSAEGTVIFEQLAQTVTDAHPDAHACRLKISLVTMDSPMQSPWDLTREAYNFIAKLAHVSAINQVGWLVG